MTLTWFERHPYLHAYRVNGHFAPYAVLARDVRFSDAELAAEYWAEEKSLGDVRGIAEQQPRWSCIEPTLLERVLVLHRFATHPHFDQNQST